MKDEEEVEEKRHAIMDSAAEYVIRMVDEVDLKSYDFDSDPDCSYSGL